MLTSVLCAHFIHYLKEALKMYLFYEENKYQHDVAPLQDPPMEIYLDARGISVAYILIFHQYNDMHYRIIR
jgi:hypothetical protein